MRAWSTLCLGLGILWAGPLSGQSRPASGPITRVDHFYAETGAMDALLRFLKRDLVEKLNGHLGRSTIRDVFFVLTSDDPGPRPGAR